jgi:hypothetical protein
MVVQARRTAWPWTPWGPTGPALDPNRDFPKGRGRFPGAPPAVLLAHGRTRGRAKASDRRVPPDVEPGGHLTLQPATEPLERTCFRCAGDAGGKHVLRPFAGSDPPISLPVCAACQRRIKRAGALRSLAVFAGTPLACTVLCVMAFFHTREGQRDEVFAYAVGGGMGLVGGLLLAAVVAVVMGRIFWGPARVTKYDHTRNLYRVRIRNPAVIEAYRKEIAAMPAVWPAEAAAFTQPVSAETGGN